ncbi:MAG TPA: hypothetical protein VMR37_01515, partial [Rhabdochlamydiaceae bacterium]|nr:hypothetical protein [Rhabdochlamydiaceae bacterium]
MPIHFQNCAFSPNSPATPETGLTPGKIHLLQQGQAHDISGRVGDFVTQYFGHNTPDAFRLTLSKNQITFIVNGQTRTLSNVPGSGWTLTDHTGAVAPALAQNLQDKIERRVNKILMRIQLAANTPDSASASPAASSPVPASAPPAAAALPAAAASGSAPDLNVLTTQLETLQTEILRSQAGMTDQLRHLVEFARELLGRLERNTGSAAEFHQELSRLSVEAQARIHQLTEENEKLQESITTLGQAARGAAENQQAKITELMGRVETLTDQLKDKDRELKALQKTLEPLQEQLAESLKTEGSRAPIMLDLDAKVRELDQKNAAQLKRTP